MISGNAFLTLLDDSELNVNSAIARPDHNEAISLTNANASNPSVDDATRTYKLAGYAYAGGGRRVNRVEISIDGGKEWRLAEMYAIGGR
jgi:nitrate reductase (NAD(P)H)